MESVLDRWPLRWTQSIGQLLICLVLAGVVSGIVLATPNVAHAQDEAKEEGEGKAVQNPIAHFFSSIGITFGIVFLALSIGTVALIIILFMDLRMSEAISPVFVDEFTNMVNKRQFKQAYELAKNDVSWLSRVLSAGMGRLQYGIEDAREAMFAQSDMIKTGKDAMISYLSAVGTLGPLLGLVGTVSGMIGAFRQLGASDKGAPNAGALAANISHALVVTLVGVAISCPAIFFFTFFKNRLNGIGHGVTTLADDLLTQMYHNSKKSGAAATQAAGSQAVTAQRG
jgi:biopolymer transport protein ExbB